MLSFVMFALAAVVAVGVIFSALAVGAAESRQEEARKPFDQAEGRPCRICGVVESAHYRITGHAWSRQLGDRTCE